MNVVVEFPLADEILYLILEFMTIIGVMPYIAVIATIFVLVHLCSFLLYGEEPSKVDLPFIGPK